MEQTVLGVFLLVTAVYIVLGNYLYFSKILPVLEEAPKFLPSAQFDDADRFLLIMDERGERPWFAPFLRHQRMIAGIYIIIFLIVVVFLVLR